jgi:hypothetical protein
MDYTIDDLFDANRRVDDGVGRVFQQRNRITWLAAAGEDTAEAERQLAVLTDELTAQAERRDVIAAYRRRTPPTG